MYFVIGARSGYSTRFQISFKYRLFDQAAGLGRDRPWLSGLYFGYTQNSVWDLSSQSRAFRDTSYRPSLFWKWERAGDKTWIDAARFGAEHESSGKDGDRSRSINTLFIRPEWHWRLRNGDSFQFTPRSEEHTSELQSHHDLVCRLLLEKKKQYKRTMKTHVTFET